MTILYTIHADALFYYQILYKERGFIEDNLKGTRITYLFHFRYEYQTQFLIQIFEVKQIKQLTFSNGIIWNRISGNFNLVLILNLVASTILTVFFTR